MHSYGLTFLALGFLSVYHFANYPITATIRRPVRFQETLSLAIGNQTAWSARIPARKLQTKTDESAARLGSWGYVLRYKLKQFAFNMVSIPGRPLRLMHREHLALEATEAARSRFTPFATHAYAFLDSLRRQGVTPVVALLPLRVGLERTRAFGGKEPSAKLWGDRNMPASTRDREHYQVYHSMLGAGGPDLFSVFENTLRQDPQADLFVPYDFHLASHGVALTAQAVLDHLGVSVPLRPTGDFSHSYRRTLLGILQLPTSFLVSNPEFQFRDWHYDLGPKPLSRPKSGRVVVAGTSFSLSLEEVGLALPDLLGTYLQRELVLSAFHGAGARGGIQRLEERGFNFKAGDIFVWEVPLSYLMMRTNQPLPNFDTVSAL